MKRIFALPLLAASVLASGTVAGFAEEGRPASMADQQQIRDALTSQGYEVRKIDFEDGMYEAYAIKDGKKMEVYLDKNLQIVRTKLDD